MNLTIRLSTLLLTLMLLSACATTQNNNDPIEPVNRVTDKVNDGLDRVTLKPLAQGYTAAVPKPVRTGVSNFYDNAASLNTVLNDFLQGKGKQGFMDFARFLINTTLGFGGMVDVASAMGLDAHEEDFGQTLAVWGFSQGAYIVYPFLGPNSVRNTPDFLTSTATSPLYWAGFVVAPYITIPVAVLNYIDTRAQLLDASNMRDELALDPYVFTREAWSQSRQFQIYDGHPPVKPDDPEDDWEEDDFDSEDSSRNAQPAAATTAQVAPAPAHTAAEPETVTQATNNAAPMTKAGNFAIYLSSHYSEAEAKTEQHQLSKLGITTRIVTATIEQHTWYRLQAGSYARRDSADTQLSSLKTRTGLNSAWVEPVTL